MRLHRIAIHQAVFALRFSARDLEGEIRTRRMHGHGRQRDREHENG
jgi:hypothetical protein